MTERTNMTTALSQTGLSEDVLKTELKALRHEHESVEEAISELERLKPDDRLTLRRLKKHKLRLKDSIALIEDALLPELWEQQPKAALAELEKMIEARYNKNEQKQRIARGIVRDDATKTVQRSLRLSEGLSQGVESAARASGLSQQEWIRRLFEAAVDHEAPSSPTGKSGQLEISHEGLSTTAKTPKKQMNLRLEEEVFEAVVQAASLADVPRNDWLRAAVIQALKTGLDVHETLEPHRDDFTQDP